MNEGACYLVITLKKIVKKKENMVVFTVTGLAFGTLSEEKILTTYLGNKYPFIENYEETTEKEFYAFPMFIADDEDEFLSAFAEGKYSDLIHDLMKKIGYNKFCPMISVKDGKNVVVISEQDFNGNYSFPDFNKAYTDPTNLHPKPTTIPIEEEIEYTEEEKGSVSRTEVVNFLKERIICQDEQIEALVSSVLSNQKYGNYEGLKENILIIGSTGTGKTEMASSLAKILDVPFVKVDATKYSTTGWKGDDVINMLKALFIAADEDLERAETGIIFVDEFDKLGYTDSGSSIRSKDVQQELLGIISGGNYTFSLSNDCEVTIDSSKITFIFGGAFHNVIEALNKKTSNIGFGVLDEEEKPLSTPKITREDLIKKGNLERELLGRISTIIQLNNLYEEDLKTIMNRSNISNLRVWQDAFLNEDNVVLTFTEASKNMLAKKAYELGSGARGIQSVVTNSIKEIRQEILDGNLENCEVIVDEATIIEPKEYKVKKLGEKKRVYELSKSNE